jgi:hypothetical protein
MKKMKKDKFKLSARERLLLHKIRSYYEDGLHKIGPRSYELNIVLNQKPLNEDDMRDYIIAAYKNNLNITTKRKYEEKESLDSFLISVQTYKEIFKNSAKSLENYNKIISELVFLNNQDLI